MFVGKGSMMINALLLSQQLQMKEMSKLRYWDPTVILHHLLYYTLNIYMYHMINYIFLILQRTFTVTVDFSKQPTSRNLQPKVSIYTFPCLGAEFLGNTHPRVCENSCFFCECLDWFSNIRFHYVKQLGSKKGGVHDTLRRKLIGWLGLKLTNSIQKRCCLRLGFRVVG